MIDYPINQTTISSWVAVSAIRPYSSQPDSSAADLTSSNTRLSSSISEPLAPIR